jgi:hypothetical protein
VRESPLRMFIDKSLRAQGALLPMATAKNGAPERPAFWPSERAVYIAAISASPNSEHFTSFAPSIMRAKS